MRLLAFPLVAAMLVSLSGSQTRSPEGLEPARSHSRPGDLQPGSARFVWVDAYIDPKGVPLAAYQFELTARGADVALVGVEGGEHPAFTQPPYYDPKANVQNRIVIAGYSTASDLPQSRTRVARVMLRINNGSATYSAKLQTAASPEARPIDAHIDVLEGAAQ